jgi:hypothetical protein
MDPGRATTSLCIAPEWGAGPGPAVQQQPAPVKPLAMAKDPWTAAGAAAAAGRPSKSSTHGSGLRLAKQHSHLWAVAQAQQYSQRGDPRTERRHPPFAFRAQASRSRSKCLAGTTGGGGGELVPVLAEPPVSGTRHSWVNHFHGAKQAGSPRRRGVGSEQGGAQLFGQGDVERVVGGEIATQFPCPRP